jgi:hypothetical protein
MANLKISQLTGATTPLAGTEVLAIVQSGTTKQVSVTNLTSGRAVTVDGVTDTTLTASKPVFTDASKKLTSSGTVPVDQGGTGQTTAQAAINTLAGATTSGQYLRGSGTNVVMSAIQAGDVPTLNQNTTGVAANVTGTVAIANGGTGATTAAAARTGLGATTLGSNLFTVTNPSAITFPRFNADNTVSSLSAADFRTAIGTSNGTVTSVAALTLGTTGTDLTSTVANGTSTPVITLNVPTASASNRGALSSTDWSTFNAKQSVSAPVTKTADFTVAATELWLINNKTGSSCVVTLPTASTNTGRVLNFQNYQAQTLVSATSNVVPLAGGSAGTAILDAVAGANATLVSNGTDWLVTRYDANNSLTLE